MSTVNLVVGIGILYNPSFETVFRLPLPDLALSLESLEILFADKQEIIF